jgi:hypothetical protein
MKTKKTSVIVFLFTLVIGRAFAQEPETTLEYVPDKYFYINLDVNTPLANKEWLDATTARGLKAGYRQFLSPSFSAGVDIGWASFSQYFPTETFEYPNGALTTDYFNYLTSMSVTLSAQYNFQLKSELFYPYVGVGLGAMGNQYTTYYNIYTDQDKSWGFLARPEAGVLIRLSKRKAIGGMAAIHYDYSTNEFEGGGYTNFSAVGFQIGIMFMDWRFGY